MGLTGKRTIAFFGAVAALAACGGSSSTPGPAGPGSATDPTSPGGTASASGGTGDPGGNPAGQSDGGEPVTPPLVPTAGKIKTVFVIMMENHSLSSIKGSKSAPYINGTLLADGAYATAYKTPPGNHPSEPNYIWLEAGDNLTITTDDDPAKNHKSTTDHFVTQLEGKGFTWKAYVESVDGTTCPLATTTLFAPKHTPQLFFDDVTDTNQQTSKHCIDHVRPYEELATDLAKGTVAQYNFLTPNICDDMHGEAFGSDCDLVTTDMIALGDTWLSKQIPAIQATEAYKDGGVILVLWDEGDEPLVGNASDGPIPLIVVSPLAKPGANGTAYTHSSTLRTLETIFGVPYLRGAAGSNDLSAMFTSFP